MSRIFHIFRRICFLALLALFALIGLTACHHQKPADLVMINGAEPETVDPAIITGQPEGRIANALFEGLTSFGPDGKPVPGVAKSWEISPNAKTYTFHLRDNAKWSDGKVVTAQDFVNSWKRTLTPSTASGYAYILYGIKNAEAYGEGKITDFSQVGVKALDDKTLQVELESPIPYFLDLCAFVTYQPVRLDIVEKFGDSWIKPGNIVTNGAYTMESWRINDKMRLRKSPTYWNADAVKMNTVDILPISQANTAFNFYLSGAADLTLDKGLVPPSLLDELKHRADFHAAPFLGSYFLRFNCVKSPFKDERVRKAFSMAVDKKRITEKITRAGELPAKSFVPPGIAGYSSPDALPYNPEEARRLLAEAGYPGGKGFPLVRYLYSEGELNQAIAEEILDMWKQNLGVTINLTRQEWKVYLNSLTSLDYDIARSTWVGDYADPNTFLDMFITDGGNNRTGWSSKQYDAWIAAASREPDPAKRLEILKQAEKLLIDTAAPICPLYYYVGIQLYDADRLGGIQPNLLDEHPIKSMFWKKSPR
ncbi:MAG: peptide ABC transporter substrate-binding protein [Chthoniobacterales bacterium]